MLGQAMKMLSKLSVITVLAVLAWAPVSAGSPAPGAAGGYQVEVSGQVPVICRVSIGPSSIPDATGRISLGTMTEFCNNPSGYRVVLDRSAFSGPAILIVDGREIPLSSGQSSVISQSSNPAFTMHKVELDLGGGGQVGSLAFRIEPL